MKKALLLFVPIFIVSLLMGGCKEDKLGGPEYTLSLEPATDITYEAKGGSTTIQVTTDSPKWNVISNQEWCVVRQIDSKSFSITVEVNTDEAAKPQATVTVTAGDKKSVTLKVNQEGKLPMQTTTFEIKLSEPTPFGVEMEVTPSDNATLYYFDVVPTKDLADAYGGDITKLLAASLKAALDYYDDVESAVKGFSSQGVASYSYTKLIPNTEYQAFAIGVHLDGTPSTPAKQTVFNTPELTSQLTFEVKFTQTYFDGADYTITPSDMEQFYYTTTRPAALYVDKTNDEILQQILAEDGFMLGMFSTTGETVSESEHLDQTDTEMMVLVFGYSGGYSGAPTTPLYKFSYRTEKPDVTPAACMFTVAASDLTARSATLTITPSGTQNMFAFDLIDEEAYLANKTNMKEYVSTYVKDNLWLWSGLSLSRGETSYTYFQSLTPGSKYYVWTACIDEFGMPAADVQISEPFSTLPAVISDAVATGKVEKYFNGDDLYAMDPVTYAAARGKAYVPVSFTANKKCTVWYGQLYAEDPQDPSTAISDAELSQMMTSGLGIWCATSFIRYCEWGAEHGLLAVGVASDENTGPLDRQKLVFTKAGAAPISEFVAPQAPAHKAMKAAFDHSPRIYKTVEK